MVEATIIYAMNIIQAGLLAWAISLLVGKQATTKQLLIFAFAYGIMVPLTRKLYLFFELPFYTHTLILLIWAFILYMLVIRLSVFKAMVGTLLGLLLFLICDGLIIIQLSRAFGISMESVASNIWLFVFFSNIVNLWLLLIVALNKFFGFSLFKKENE